MVAAAITTPKSLDASVLSMVMATWAVLISFTFVTIRGHRYVFQVPTKEEMKTVTRAGVVVGRRIYRKNCRFPQPSIWAASFKDRE